MFRDGASGGTRDSAGRPKKIEPGERTDLERERDQALVTIAALGATLDAMGTPTFVLRQTADIEYANSLGLALLEANRRSTTAALRAALAGRGDRYLVTELGPHGAPDHFLVVERPPPATAVDKAAAAGARWSLTPRQREVLAHVACGKCNKTIAAELGCAERTIELHVTACLEKAHCEQRAELVAKVWGLP